MEKYHPFIKSINSGLCEFSRYLQPDFNISIIDEIKLKDPGTCWSLLEKGWDETQFPNSGNSGVYFIFGRKKDDEKHLGVYVGKASHNSFIGKRLYAHLHNPKRADRVYPMRDKQGNEFLLEFVVTIPMNELYFFAPALEEFLIYKLQEEDIYLINAVGKN